MRKFYTKQLFVAMVALLCSVAVTAHDFEVDGIFYNVSGDGVYVTYIGSSSGLYYGGYSGSVVIPESITYNGKNYSVTSIGEYAFYECTGLTSVVIPNSVTSIGYYAFDGCSGLTSVVIPNSVTSIGYYAFDGCSGLTSIVVENGNKKYDSRNNCNAIIETETNTLIAGCKNTNIPNSVTSIGDYAFRNCSGLTSITIPNSVTSIGECAFYGCSGLTNITIPNNVTSIGSSAFYGTAWYNNQPDGVVYIGKVLYEYKGKMPDGTSIVIKDGTLSIAGSAFDGCSGLTSITIPNSVTSIGDGAFSGCSGLTSITIPNSVTSIGDYAFRNCSGLTSITIPNSVTNIGDGAFYGCSGLTSVTIPNSVTSIGDYAFGWCDGLTSVTIGNGVVSIGSGAFYACYGLTSVTIGNSVTSIGNEAFYARYLKSIYLLGEIPPEIFSNTFSNYDATLYVPKGSLAAYQSANVWNKFKNIVEFDPTDIEDVTEDVPTFEVTAGGIQLTAADGKAVAVYTTGGALVEKIDCYAGEEITLDKGVYIIRVGEKAVKIKL